MRRAFAEVLTMKRLEPDWVSVQEAIARLQGQLEGVAFLEALREGVVDSCANVVVAVPGLLSDSQAFSVFKEWQEAAPVDDGRLISVPITMELVAKLRLAAAPARPVRPPPQSRDRPASAGTKFVRQTIIRLGKHRLSPTIWDHAENIDFEKGTFQRFLQRPMRPFGPPNGVYRFKFDLQLSDIDLAGRDLSRLLRAFETPSQRSSSTENEKQDQKAAKCAPGRPQKYDWEAFWLRVALIANQPDGLPEKQADLVSQMLNWCSENWGGEPGVSTVKDRLSKLYRLWQSESKRTAPGDRP